MSGQRVGVVGDGGLVERIKAAGATPVVGDAETLTDVEFVVASGEPAVVDLARAGVTAPVLLVGAGSGLRSLSSDSVEVALERLLDGDYPTQRQPILAARGAFDEVRALFDVALMAAEPARISEFSVRSGDEHVARFRADGVVASTPAGSPGYNNAAHGPVVAPETGVLSVVPIAPFATDADRWILPLDGVTLSVERDETPVELLVDGRRERSVAAGDSVSLTHVGDLRTYIAPEGERFF